MNRPDPARIAALFDALVDLPPDEAARRLAELDGEPELRRAVERLLASDREVRPDLFDPLGVTFAATAHDPGSQGAPPPTVTPSSRVGRFVLVRKLGEGGMGAVYLGYDERLDRRVAIKLLHHGAAEPERLVREAQALAKLSHPNVVPVYEVGEHEGRIFLAMEFVDGPTLGTFLAEGRPLEEVLRVFVQAGRGLAAAHAAGLVHRDFKPDNVLVGAEGRPRVADFGIAGLAHPAAKPRVGSGGSGAPGDTGGPAAPVVLVTTEDGPTPDARASALMTPLTRTGAIVGTPAFMSPEQYRGEHATPASDQFSFCVALYRAVYGVAPFAGDSFIELMQSVGAGALRPAPRAPAAPGGLAPILIRGLSRRPEDRFPTMDALLEALEAHLPRDPSLDPARTRRERWLVGLLLLVLSIGMTAFVFGRGVAAALPTTWDLVKLAAILLAASGAAVALLWKRLATNLAGKRFAYVLLLGMVLMLLGRLIGVRLGFSVEQEMVLDLLHVVVIFAYAAVIAERWFGAVAAVGVAALGLAALEPRWSVASFALYTLLAAAACVYFWTRPSAPRR
ncbi:MAG TPA: serine/threonine-protein kinase [Polyangia bacterium]|nr:serine/threonine-protein kinase [Polyangia bacterium]